MNNAFPSRKMKDDCELAHIVSGNRTSTRVRWRTCFPLKLFRNFTEKRTRALSLQMVFSLLFPETLLDGRVLCQVTWRDSTTWRLGIPKHREKTLANTREVLSSSRRACDCRSASKRFPLMFEGVRYMGRVSLGYWLALMLLLLLLLFLTFSALVANPKCKHLTPFLFFLYFVKPCEPLSAFRFFLFFGASAWHRKTPQVYLSVVYTPRHANTSSHSKTKSWPPT